MTNNYISVFYDYVSMYMFDFIYLSMALVILFVIFHYFYYVTEYITELCNRISLFDPQCVIYFNLLFTVKEN